MTEGRLIVQSSSFEGALDLIAKIESQYDNVTSTSPVKAADGTYLVSIHYDNKKLEVPLVDRVSTRIL